MGPFNLDEELLNQAAMPITLTLHDAVIPLYFLVTPLGPSTL